MSHGVRESDCFKKKFSEKFTLIVKTDNLLPFSETSISLKSEHSEQFGFRSFFWFEYIVNDDDGISSSEIINT